MRIAPEAAIAPHWVVYRLLGERDQLLYIGMTGDLRARMLQHKTQPYWRQVRNIETEEFADRDGAAMREADLIFELDPPLNSVGRRTYEGEGFVQGAHGPVASCPDCTAMGLVWCGDDLIDAQYVGVNGTAFGNAGWFHRCAGFHRCTGKGE